MGKDLHPFICIKQCRRSAEYPKRDEPTPTTQDVLEDCANAHTIGHVCTKALKAIPVLVTRA